MKACADRRDSWQSARSMVVYYGRDATSQLSRYDVAIVEPLGQTTETLNQLKAAGTLLLAYLSVMEMPAWDAGIALLDLSDFLRCNGQAITNSEHGTYLLDLRSTRWQRLLFHRASILLDQGYDGLFLDTIGDVELPIWSPLQQIELVANATALVRQLRAIYPQHLLVQNNGLARLIEQTAPHLSGVCWENPHPDLRRPDLLTQVLLRIGRLAGHNNCRLLLLSQHDHRPADLPLPPQILAYCAPGTYTDL